MSLETKQLHALSRIYKEAVYGGAKKEAPKDTRMVVTAADKLSLIHISSPRDVEESRMPSSA